MRWAADAGSDDDERLSWRSFGDAPALSETYESGTDVRVSVCACAKRRRCGEVAADECAHTDASADGDFAQLIDRRAQVNVFDQGSQLCAAVDDESESIRDFMRPEPRSLPRLTDTDADATPPRSSHEIVGSERAPVITLRVERASERVTQPQLSQLHPQVVRELPSTSEMVGISETQPTPLKWSERSSVQPASHTLRPRHDTPHTTPMLLHGVREETEEPWWSASASERSPPHCVLFNDDQDGTDLRQPASVAQQRQPMSLSQLLTMQSAPPSRIFEPELHQRDNQCGQDQQRIQQLEAELRELRTQVGDLTDSAVVAQCLTKRL